MRILIINDFCTDIGGAEKSVILGKKVLEEKGHKTYLYAPEKKESRASLISRIFSLKHHIRIKKIIKKFKPDIIRLHGIFRVISPSVILAAKKAKIPIVMALHDYHIICPKTWMIYKNAQPCPYGFGLRCLFSNCYSEKKFALHPYNLIKWIKILIHRKIILKNIDYYTSPSPTLTKYAKKFLKIANITTIKSYVNLENHMKNKNIKRNYKQFLFVGRLEKEKGIDTVIKSLYLTKKTYSDVKLKIIGDGKAKNKLKKLVKKLNLQDNIKFLGKIPNKELSKYYQEACSTIAPSRWMENFANVSLESMSNKTPIIASNIGGYLDQIDHEKTGYIVNPNNYKEISEYMKKLYNNKKLVSKLGNAGFKKLQKECNKKQYYEKIITIFNKIINENKS